MIYAFIHISSSIEIYNEHKDYLNKKRNTEKLYKHLV